MANLKAMKNTDIIFLIEDEIDGVTVTVDIEYSGEGDDLKFETSKVSRELNTDLTDDQLRNANKAIECGRETFYVTMLADHYKSKGMTFHHYQIIC